MDEVNTSDTAKVIESVIMRATSLSTVPSAESGCKLLGVA